MEPTRTLEQVPPGASAPDAAAVPASGEVTLPVVPMRMGAAVRDAWRERALLPRLAVRFLLKRIRGTKLQHAWLVIRPLMASLGMTLLFGTVLGVETRGAPYFVFLLAGLVGWVLFERSMLYTTRSFSIYGKFMKTLRFPLLLVPLAGMGYPAVEVAVYWAVLGGSLVFYWIVDGTLYLSGFPRLLWIVPALTLLLGITVGASLWLSVLNAKARDVRYTIRYVTPIWMYVTPVVYPISKLPESIQWLGIVNPMSGPIELLRWGLIGEGDINMPALLSSVGIGGALLLSGLWYFCREAARSIDAIPGPDDDEDEEL